MLRHVAMFTWKPETSEAQVQALMEGLAQLPRQIPGIQDYRFGPDAGLEQSTDAFMVVGDFDDVDAFQRYVAHPAHQELVANLVSPIVATRHAVQLLI